MIGQDSKQEPKKLENSKIENKKIWKLVVSTPTNI